MNCIGFNIVNNHIDDFCNTLSLYYMQATLYYNEVSQDVMGNKD